MDHHALCCSPHVSVRKLRNTATPPMMAETSLAVACHLLLVSSAGANISHAVPAMHIVSKCRPAQPLIPAKLKAMRQLTANNKPARPHAENVIVRVTASHAVAAVIDKRLSQPRKLPAALVPVPTSLVNSKRENNAGSNSTAVNPIANHNCCLSK